MTLDAHDQAGAWPPFPRRGTFLRLFLRQSLLGLSRFSRVKTPRPSSSRATRSVGWAPWRSRLSLFPGRARPGPLYPSPSEDRKCEALDEPSIAASGIGDDDSIEGRFLAPRDKRILSAWIASFQL